MLCMTCATCACCLRCCCCCCCCCSCQSSLLCQTMSRRQQPIHLLDHCSKPLLQWKCPLPLGCSWLNNVCHTLRSCSTLEASTCYAIPPTLHVLGNFTDVVTHFAGMPSAALWGSGLPWQVLSVSRLLACYSAQELQTQCFSWTASPAHRITALAHSLLSAMFLLRRRDRSIITTW